MSYSQQKHLSLYIYRWVSIDWWFHYCSWKMVHKIKISHMENILQIAHFKIQCATWPTFWWTTLICLAIKLAQLFFIYKCTKPKMWNIQHIRSLLKVLKISKSHWPKEGLLPGNTWSCVERRHAIQFLRDGNLQSRLKTWIDFTHVKTNNVP